MNEELWLTWKEPKSRKRYKVGTLIKYDDNFVFKYVEPELKDAIDAGFQCFPGFEDTKKEYCSDKLFANIKTRLPNVNRPDYLEILNSYNLDKEASEFEILKAVKGRLLTDNYEFVPAFDKNKIEFDVAGTRYSLDIKKCENILSINDKLYLELEPNNKHDKYAIKVIYKKENKKYQLGYVPRYYSKQLSELLNKNISYSAMVQSVNFKSKINDEYVCACVKLIFDI